ncbi:MAG: hypothetical protein QOF76_4700 [Solirubrobacteraceae bacterium]|nr:hypothetical protein [Solirubrobacteraceae bacterium]
MRAVALSVAVCLLAGATAMALSYEPGIYSAGKQKKGTGVTLNIEPGYLTVRRIGFVEHCTGPSHAFDEPVSFVEGSSASLAGPINKHGRFSERYASGGSVFKVKGHVSGTIATITGTEHGSFDRDGETLSCHGSQTFKAHASLTTGGR